MPKEAAVLAKIGDITGVKVVLEVYYCELTVAPASVAAASVAAQTFTLAGLATGDMVTVSPGVATIGVAGIRVSAADTLQVIFVNPTASAIVPASSTWKVLVIRPVA